MPRTRSIAWAELKLGVVGIVALLLVAILVVAVGGTGGFPWERYPLKTRFPDAAGLKPGAVVRLSGKDVGTVSSVEFRGPALEVVFEITKDVRHLVTTESRAAVGSLSLLGESMLDLQAAPTGSPLADWGYVPAGAAGGMGGLTTTATETLASAREIVADLRAGRGTIGRLLTDDAVYREVEQLVTAAADVAQAIRSGRGTLGALTTDRAAYDALKGSVEHLQGITARITSGSGALGRLLNDEALGRSMATMVTNLEQTTGRLGRGEGTLGKLLTDAELYDRLNAVSARVEQVLAGLESGQGTAGRLLRDQQLYENMNRAVAELRDLFAEVRKDPKKFLSLRVSIF
jgi:phospholipid/cholesterol/gamma-HCH transport system substrate-binding protein